jgi:membrane protease YdiL (CAAX protease family)
MIAAFALSIYVVSGFFFFKLILVKGFSLPGKARESLDHKLKLRHFLAAIATWFFCQVIVTSFFNKLALQDILKLNFRQWFCFVDFFTNLTIIGCLFAIIRCRKLHVLGAKNALKTGLFYGIELQLPLMFGMELLQSIVDLFGQFVRGQEVCENLLDDCSQFPWLYAMTFFSFAVLCPIVEELIFRGFLQNWLVNKIGALFGILLTSALFAGAHYSHEQAAANVELLTAIFALSCIFGIVYFKTRSITGSIGMHITNNVIALILRTN